MGVHRRLGCASGGAVGEKRFEHQHGEHGREQALPEVRPFAKLVDRAGDVVGRLAVDQRMRAEPGLKLFSAQGRRIRLTRVDVHCDGDLLLAPRARDSGRVGRDRHRRRGCRHSGGSGRSVSCGRRRISSPEGRTTSTSLARAGPPPSGITAGLPAITGGRSVSAPARWNVSRATSGRKSGFKGRLVQSAVMPVASSRTDPSPTSSSTKSGWPLSSRASTRPADRGPHVIGTY